MNTRMKIIVALILLVTEMYGCTQRESVQHVVPVSNPPRDFDRGWYPTEVASLPAIRRLHLVRPDLIPYPLCIETYC